MSFVETGTTVSGAGRPSILLGLGGGFEEDDVGGAGAARGG